MTDVQFKQLLDKLERIEALLRGANASSFLNIPQHLWTDYERVIAQQREQNR